jgi:hypothetical protein
MHSKNLSQSKKGTAATCFSDLETVLDFSKSFEGLTEKDPEEKIIK